MKTTRYLTLAIFGALLGGCATQQPPQAKAGPMKECVPRNTQMDTCDYSTNPAVCHVYVAGNQDNPVVYPYNLKVKSGAKATVVWTLLDPGARFRDNNDGPDFGNNTEFMNGGTAMDPNGRTSAMGAPSQHYKIDYGNTKPATTHKYNILFKPETADSVRCDPTITSGGGV